MPSTYSDLKIQLMATGENSGTWGNVTNTNLGTAIEEAITGSADVTFASNNQTLSLTDTNASQPARNLRLNLTGTTGGATRTLTVPSIEKVYIINNGCANAVEVKNSTGSNVSVPAGKTMWVYNTGSNVVDVTTHLTTLTLGSPLPVASGGTGSNTGTFSGANITSINASNISSGTLANARTTAASTNGASTIVARDASGNFTGYNVSATNFIGALNGSGANVTSINANNISAGVLAVAQGGTGSNTATFSGANISSINASNISSGTLANARTTASSSNGASTIVARDASGNFTGYNVSATNFIGSGANVSSINASNISSGTIANARTTASDANGASTIVARDASGNFSANVITANGSAITSINASNISSGTLANARTTASSSNGASTIVSRDANGSFSANAISATTLTGAGSGITSLNASNISSGTLAIAQGGTNASNSTTALSNLGGAPLASPTFTGTPAAPTAASGTNTTQLATTAFVQAALQVLHPIGSIYINATNSTNPGTLLGFGTWVAFGAGRVPVGFDSGDPLFDTAEETGGSKDAIVVSHTHTATSTVTDPGHSHNLGIQTAGTAGGGIFPATSNYQSNYIQSNTTGITVATTNSTEGSSGTNKNIQPYITVYMWKRTA